MPSNYRVADAIKRIEKKHGRTVNEETLSRRSRVMFGKTTGLTAREVIKLSRAMKTHNLYLTQTVRSEIKQYLLLNQKLPVYERKSHEQIAQLVGGRFGTPISSGAIKKMNREIVAKVKAKGKRPVAFSAKVDPDRAHTLKRLKDLLKSDYSVSLDAAAKKLGLKKDSLQRNLQRYGTSFQKERTKTKKALLELWDIKSERALLNVELAERTGLPEPFVRKNRQRGHKGRAVRARQAEAFESILTWIGLFTSPKKGVINMRIITSLVSNGIIDINGAISQLKKQRLIKELDTKKPGLIFTPEKGQRYFSIAPNGQRRINGAGLTHLPVIQRVKEMSLEKIEKSYDMLVTIRVSSLMYVSNRILSIFRVERDRKRFEEFKRKNKM